MNITTTQAQTSPVVILGLLVLLLSSSTKKRLRELTKFDNTRSYYLSWKLEVISKLKYDEHLIENDRARLIYLFMRIELDT